jgi:hypothetical protein
LVVNAPVPTDELFAPEMFVKVPPGDFAACHWMVLPVLPVSVIVVLPLRQTALAVGVAVPPTDVASTVTVVSAELACVGLAHVSLEVNVTWTVSPFARLDVEYVAVELGP